jgi:hypothetical protein
MFRPVFRARESRATILEAEAAAEAAEAAAVPARTHVEQRHRARRVDAPRRVHSEGGKLESVTKRPQFER